ncbi:MAG: adenylyltransferase/cytidyltransferase family protein [Kineothrix sp.]|nr:adenylyltransferase/cytidyltransferase family protein [Kineothrix sp.]
MGYERKQGHIRQDSGEKPQKKYHVGYISGVFDLFHVGHLNMFKRAKEQCDYLIVGVVTDDGVRNFKKVEPFVPFEERIEMVRSCRYVDEAVEIPLEYNDTREAYKLYHFDCQFSGSDYIDRPAWISNREFLERNGSELVFFPYTESTSSSKMKALIEKKLI